MKRIIQLVLATSLCGTMMYGATKSHQSDYSRGVNAALNTTLIVGNEWKAMRLRPTWAQIDAEVARRLHIQRRRP